MKFLKIMIISCLFLVAAQSVVFAGSGKAIVPHWLAQNDGNTNIQSSNIFISNITQHDLKIKISIYNKDSTLITSGLEYKNFKNNRDEIGAGQTVNLKINADHVGGTADYGYAVIEWENLDYHDDVVGLIAWADWRETGNRGYSVQVNNGMPF